MSEVYSLVYSPEHQEPADHYYRVAAETVQLVTGHGIKSDVKGSQPERGLNIMAYETLQTLGAEGFMAQPGQMGEQITLRGLDVNALAAGTRLQLGDTAVVEIIKPRTGCDRFEAIQGRKRQEVDGRMGMMARVLVGGALRVGDSVTVLETVES
jgi:MOSC domain-containing protein YiiM